MIYKANLPLLRLSTAPVDITDENGNRVGMMKRYYSNKKQKIINMLFDNIVNNVHAYDREGESVADVKEIITLKTLVSEKWDVEMRGNRFLCEQKSKIRTNPQFYYERDDAKVWIKKDFADKTTRFIIDGQLAAEVYPEGIAPPKSCQITFDLKNSALDIFEVASLYYVFILKN